MIDVFQGIGSFAVDWILPTLFVFTLIVFFHELGHFLVARWCGVTVRVFSIGFGPEIVGFTDRKATRWRLSAIPIGGYVRFLGDENVASVGESLAELTPEERAGAFAAQSVGRRAAIVAAGPIANFLLAIVILTLLFSLVGERLIPARVDEVTPDGPAAAAGFLPGDMIVAIDGDRIATFTDFQQVVALRTGDELLVTVARDGAELLLRVTPERRQEVDRYGNTSSRGIIGVTIYSRPEDPAFVRYSLPESVGRAVAKTWETIESTVLYLGRVISGRESLDQLGGPVAVARVASEAAEIGFATLLSLAAFLSISIGFANLLPIPLLDGGHLLFFGIEAIRRRPVAVRVQEAGSILGLVLILALIVVAFVNDFT